jgi:hypothetical protein
MPPRRTPRAKQETGGILPATSTPTHHLNTRLPFVWTFRFGANVVNTLEGTVASLEGSKAFNLDHVAVHELGLAAKMLKDSSAAMALHKSARVRNSVDSFVEITGAKANELKEKVAEKVAVAEQGLRDAKVGLAMALEETKDGIAKDGIAKGVWGFGEHFVKHVRRDAQSPTAAP